MKKIETFHMEQNKKLGINFLGGTVD